MMRLKNCLLRLAVAALFSMGLAVCEVGATSFKLSDFFEMDRSQVQSLLPNLLGAYPTARFLRSGFTSPSGTWTFVRVETSAACEGQFCLTVIIHDKVEWKVLAKITKDVGVALNYENDDESVQCELQGKTGVMIIRSMGGEKVLYVVQ
jgi:hypothetical protein